MKTLILCLTIIFTTNSFASAGDGSSGITSAGDGSSGITSAGDGSSGVSSIGDIQFMQLGNGFIRSCFHMQNNTTACTIIRQ